MDLPRFILAITYTAVLFNKLRTAHAAIFNEIETSPPFHGSIV